MRNGITLSATLFLCLSLSYAEEETLLAMNTLKPPEKETVGWIEKVRLLPSNLLIHAKIDTGADMCSLNTSDIRISKKGDKKWVNFKVTNRYGESSSFRLPAHRIARIKRIGAESHERVVVRMGVCLGNRHMEVDVNLVDRSHFTFGMLIGRNFLAANANVDSALTYTTDPDCSNNTKKGESRE